VGLDQPELPGVMPQACLGRAHVRGIKAPAGEQGGVGPGGGAGQDGHGAGGGTAARQFRYSLYEYTVLSWLSPMSAATPETPADDYLSDLNPAQRAAAEFGAGQADAPALLVIAGAGSGKTSTRAHRVAHLIVNGADPQRILLLTFSRRAALEMDRRVGMVLRRVMKLQPSQQAPSLPWAGTFHSIGARLLRDCATRIGLSESFTIHDRGDAEDLMGMVRHEAGLSSTTERFPLKGTCLAIYSRVINSQAPVADVLKQAFPWCAQWEEALKRLFAAYVQAKQEQQVLDYDDLLLYWSEMMQDPVLAHDVGSRFDHVLVDEYQDTNRLQASILLAMKPDGHGLTVVGDDAQSVYSFRAATVRNILDSPQHFARPAHVITLERNYRSTQPILDASNAVIAQAAERYSKTLWTDRASSARPALVTVSDEAGQARWVRSEEHTSELQSRENLVCRLLLEKKNDRNRQRSIQLTK